MTLSGRSYITHAGAFLQQLPVVRKPELSSVSWEQVKSKDVPYSDD